MVPLIAILQHCKLGNDWHFAKSLSYLRCEKSVFFFWINLMPEVFENNGGEFPLGLAASSIPSSFSGGKLFLCYQFPEKIKYVHIYHRETSAVKLAASVLLHKTDNPHHFVFTPRFNQTKRIDTVLLLYIHPRHYMYVLPYMCFNAKKYTRVWPINSKAFLLAQPHSITPPT